MYRAFNIGTLYSERCELLDTLLIKSYTHTVHDELLNICRLKAT